jgi:hypothetical protein
MLTQNIETPKEGLDRARVYRGVLRAGLLLREPLHERVPQRVHPLHPAPLRRSDSRGSGGSWTPAPHPSRGLPSCSRPWNPSRLRWRPRAPQLRYRRPFFQARPRAALPCPDHILRLWSGVENISGAFSRAPGAASLRTPPERTGRSCAFSEAREAAGEYMWSPSPPHLRPTQGHASINADVQHALPVARCKEF